MSPFRFRLQRVLELRRTQFQIAEIDYSRALSKLHAAQASRATLAEKQLETRRSFSRMQQVQGQDLAPLGDWYRWADGEASRLTGVEQAAAQEVEKRRLSLVEAQRKTRLLEKLRDQRQKQWQSAFDKEIESLAADSTSSRYARAGTRDKKRST
jgi:flagellar export protein FliJ